MKTNLNSYKIFFLLYSILILTNGCSDDEDASLQINPSDMPYSVEINPSDFKTDNINGNLYFPIVSGTTYVYEGKNEEGNNIRVEEEYTNDTKIILGVTCIIVHATEYENNELIEDTYDWYAQDNTGNLWYFGEYSEEIKNGVVVSTDGSWEAGIDNALPGVIMFANPISGLWYRQEYYKNEAEDVAQIISLNESITITYSSFTNCLKIAEWSPLEPSIMEHKYYAPEIGLVKVISVKGESGYEELTHINN
ncbi:MAG: hypothetical protein A2041_06300 [Bacteroidetes bacterium GWA2_31_9b]|nr:MAG: hypothetical protein A2041_06300 [Bacteroidetes bacterium GWA2_31_9b]